MKQIFIKNPRGGLACSTTAEEYTVEARGGELTVSDGSHTFEELYEHRNTLFIALCRALFRWVPQHGTLAPSVWRSKLHNDGSMYDGWFVMGITEELGSQMTYHLPIALWGETDFAATLDHAPKWDGHSSTDVLERLKAL